MEIVICVPIENKDSYFFPEIQDKIKGFVDI